MNVREWTGNDTNKTLNTVVSLMVSVSLVTIGAVVILAFPRPILDGTSATVKKTVITVKNGHKRFQTLRNWWESRRGKREEDGDDFSNIEAGIASPGNVSWLGSGVDLDRVEKGRKRRWRD